MKLFQASINYQVNADGKKLHELFEPWVRKRRLADWRQLLVPERIFDGNKILFHRIGTKSMLRNDVLFELNGDELQVTVKARREQFVLAFLIVVVFAVASIFKGPEWKFWATGLLFGVVFFSLIAWSVREEKSLVKKDIWQELHIQKIKFKELKKKSI